MKKINWGIIGCGDVTELKSGPAFNKVAGSSLVAVMRRDAGKAEDYALRHNVPRWYTDAAKLINDPEVNAVYIATPPSSHEEYLVASANAGKPVYVEKPMSVSYTSAQRMAIYAEEKNVKMSVAHYRRAQPLFKRIRQLIHEKAIGDILFVQSEISKPPLTQEELADPRIRWRVDTAVAGGGLFNDLSPHQLDLMYYFFGPVKIASGISVKHGLQYDADDMVAGNILFESGVVFSGTWSFNVAPDHTKDLCQVTGTKGKMSFSFFSGTKIQLEVNGQNSVIEFEPLQHVQQPMIEAVVKYFSGQGSNPCSGREGAEVMRLIDVFTTAQ